MAKQNNDLTLKVGFDIDKFQAEMNKTTGVLNKWATGVQNSLMGVAAGFSALALGEFVLDVSKLAGEAEGVRIAFEKLPNSVQLMRELKDATAGTVSELDLMKRSVMAANFGINIEALPKLLEFAAVRAKQTGQSVSFLADSIVTGIGRKSALILDNLGISLAAINEELKVTPDYAQAVGNIAARELEKMGGMSENTATKTERLGASWVNLKVYLGEVANGTGLLGTALDDFNNKMDLLASRNLSTWEKLLSLISPLYGLQAAVKDAALEANKMAEAQARQNQITDTATVLLRDLGLDYEALMNVAGDNVDVMEIWNEMQRLAAEYAKETSTAVDTTRLSLAKLNNEISIGLPNLKEIEAAFNRMQARAELPIIDAGIIPDEIDEKGQAMIDSLIEKQERMKASAADFVTAFNQILNQGLEQTVAGLGAAIGNIASGMGGVDQIFSALLAGVGNMAVQLGQLAIGAGIAVAGIKKALQSLNPVVAIAAGVALVALGKVVSNKANAIARGGAGGGGSIGGGGSAQPGSVRRESLGDRIVLDLQFTGDAGKILKAKMIDQDRIDSRTRA